MQIYGDDVVGLCSDHKGISEEEDDAVAKWMSIYYNVK